MVTAHPGHEAILDDALRAPSAHNAQAWRLVPTGESDYELHYDHHEYLPHDPDDRDAYLGLGAFVETMALAAARRDRRLDFRGRFVRTGSDLLVGVVSIGAEGTGSPDPLAEAAPQRHTNRSSYRRRLPVPLPLGAALTDLGCVCVAPRRVLPLAVEASVRSWADRQFVTDLRRWLRLDGRPSPDGMTPDCLDLSRVDQAALRAALRAGRLPRPVGLLFASRELRLTMASSTLAVLTAEALTPEALFDAGRRLLRAWVSISAAGWACHPISVVIDRPETAPRLARLIGAPYPVALFRVGWTDRRVPFSARRSLASVLRDI